LQQAFEVFSFVGVVVCAHEVKQALGLLTRLMSGKDRPSPLSLALSTI
jgi:hypothetical protein